MAKIEKGRAWLNDNPNASEIDRLKGKIGTQKENIY